MYYATLRDARAQREREEKTNTEGDAYLLECLRWITSRIDKIKGFEFAPRIALRYFDALGQHIHPLRRLMNLDIPLLEPTTVQNAQGTTLVLGTDYYSEPRNRTPIYGLRLAAGSSNLWSDYNVEWQDIIEVTGIWGYRSAYDEAWLSSLDTVQDNPLSDTATTITVDNADGADSLSRIPRFSPGQLLRIGSEFIDVTAVDKTTEKLTVVRGVRGSTKAEHVQSTAIEIWEPEPTVMRACLFWAVKLHAMRGKYEITRFTGTATIQFPPDAPKEVMNALAVLTFDEYDWLIV